MPLLGPAADAPQLITVTIGSHRVTVPIRVSATAGTTSKS